MKKSININVSSGTSAFGAINQGDSTQVSGVATISKELLVKEEYSRISQELLEIANCLKHSSEDLAEVQAHFQLLMKETLNQPGNVQKGGDTLKVIRENFPWAYPAIKDFLTIAWPALLAAIVT